MTRPKCFRDMSLTPDDVQERCNADYSLFERYIDGRLDRETGEWETDTSALDRVVDRAKRLLPLWRQWAIRDLSRDVSRGGHS